MPSLEDLERRVARLELLVLPMPGPTRAEKDAAAYLDAAPAMGLPPLGTECALGTIVGLVQGSAHPVLVRGTDRAVRKFAVDAVKKAACNG